MMQPRALLRHIGFFDGLTDTQLDMIASVCQERRCRAGEMVFDDNSASDEMYIITQGVVEIQVNPSLVGQPFQENESGLVTIASLGPGQVFGEIALVDQGLRTAAARCAVSGTRLLIVPRDKLMVLCTSYPELGFTLMFNLAVELALKIRGADLAIREKLYWEPLR